MKKSIAILTLCSLVFWGCDSSKTTEKATAKSETPVATVANTSADFTPADKEEIKKMTEPKKEEPTGPFGKFEFSETSHDFGDIKQGDVVEHIFKYKNVGEGPLVITNIKASCGCTTPKWTREPVAPGESGEIQVKFNSRGKMGLQNKTVTISANVEGGTDRISIRTNILKADNTADMMGPLKK